jgi:hypothetical protein
MTRTVYSAHVKYNDFECLRKYSNTCIYYLSYSLIQKSAVFNSRVECMTVNVRLYERSDGLRRAIPFMMSRIKTAALSNVSTRT